MSDGSHAHTQLSQHSLEHSTGLSTVSCRSQTDGAADDPHVALTHESQLCCSLSHGLSQQSAHTLHGVPSPAATQRCGASHAAATQASHSAGLRSRQQASHGAEQTPVAGAAQAIVEVNGAQGWLG